jgi:uncharacterized surface protein with fasciclin (FAS1) repeats
MPVSQSGRRVSDRNRLFPIDGTNDSQLQAGKTDMAASNGVVHGIDNVLFPFDKLVTPGIF